MILFHYWTTKSLWRLKWTPLWAGIDFFIKINCHLLEQTNAQLSVNTSGVILLREVLPQEEGTTFATFDRMQDTWVKDWRPFHNALKHYVLHVLNKCLNIYETTTESLISVFKRNLLCLNTWSTFFITAHMSHRAELVEKIPTSSDLRERMSCSAYISRYKVLFLWYSTFRKQKCI